MKKITALALSCVMALTLFLSGCSVERVDNTGNSAGSNTTGSSSESSGGDSGNGSQRVLNVCSWGEYIDERLIEEFEAQTGIEVN